MKDGYDPVVQNWHVSEHGFTAPNIPLPIRTFDGVGYPGVGCNCAPPDTNGAVGATQYVQIVNEGYQVFDKATGTSVLGPNSISSIWSGFGGVCETGGAGDPVVLYDHLANRWLISQFAGSGSTITDECVAISTTSDATGTYYRYGFHLGSNFYDYPHLGVWPDAYYMSMNVFNAAGTAYLGPQPFAFDRAKMLVGQPATFVSPVGPLGGSVDPFLPVRPRWIDSAAGGRAEHFRRLPRAVDESELHHLSFPRRLRHAGELDLYYLCQPGGGGLHGALPDDPGLCAAEWNHQLKLSRWHRRSTHVPAGLSELWRSRVCRGHLQREVGHCGRSALV